MDLREVTAREQFEEYYKENNLFNTDEKIKHLMKIMRIKAMQCEHGSAPQNILLESLEDCALVGSWQGYR